uniref:Uncharacterized protein n=1 Tax=Oryza brachyantha TaxID=4533 RepID=J3MD40_ORYBR
MVKRARREQEKIYSKLSCITMELHEFSWLYMFIYINCTNFACEDHHLLRAMDME